jgi:group II intron reverse transcriptase/maturase
MRRHQPYTEMETLTLTKLALISERARRESKCQFTSLAHLLDEGFLAACYYRLGRDRASGIDGVTWKAYGEDLDENLKDLVFRLKGKRYKPQPSRRTYIPKDKDSKRPLGLPALEDKIVQKGIAWILEVIYEADFLDCSYGFRPNRSCHQAIDAVDKLIMTKPINHIVEADIKGFFDNVSHEWMMRGLQVRVKDPSFLLLIQRFLKAGYMEGGVFVETEEGTPQGGNLSPMLSNIFLHYVLDLWFEKKIRPQLRGESYLVRYADDWLCLVRYQEDARYIERALRERFKKFGLELHPEKTRVISFGPYERENAVRQKRRANTFDFLGFTHYCAKSRKGRFLVGRKTSCKKFRMKCKDMNQWLKAVRNADKVKNWWPILQAKLRGHYQYYGVSGNMQALNRFYTITTRLTFKWLNRRSQRNSFNWEGFHKYLEHYPLPKPRIVHNIYTLSPVS